MITIIQLALVLITIESGGDDAAIGDNGKAYGCLQIHSAYVQDVNRILKEDLYTHEDAFNRDHAIDMFLIYSLHYCTAERLGRQPTLEDFARVHNGGPNGYKKEATKKYWEKVQQNIL